MTVKMSDVFAAVKVKSYTKCAIPRTNITLYFFFSNLNRHDYFMFFFILKASSAISYLRKKNLIRGRFKNWTLVVNVIKNQCHRFVFLYMKKEKHSNTSKGKT